MQGFINNNTLIITCILPGFLGRKVGAINPKGYQGMLKIHMYMLGRKSVARGGLQVMSNIIRKGIEALLQKI